MPKSLLDGSGLVDGASLDDVKHFLEPSDGESSPAAEFVYSLIALSGLAAATALIGPAALGLLAVKNEIRKGLDAFVEAISQRNAPGATQRVELF